MDSEELFRSEWGKCESRVFAFIRTLVYRRDDAEDLLQEVARTLWIKIDEFDVGTDFVRWALVVARNHVRNYRRKKARERISFSDSLAESLAEESATLLHAEENMLVQLQECVGKLDAEPRELLERRYESMATNRSVARAIGRSESSVSRSLNAIFRLLLKCIQRGNADQEN